MAGRPSGLDDTVPVGGSDGPAHEAALRPGMVLAARHRIVGLRGMGGMGAVYEAEDLVLGARVALKTLHLDVAWSAAALERFRREVHVAQTITHPNVCRIHDLGVHDGGGLPLPYLTMELLDGVSLAERLREGPLAADEAARVARAICAGLEAVHAAEVVHRDLKPANVMLVGGARVAVLTDFGLARPAGDAAASDEAGAGTGANAGGAGSPHPAPPAVTALAGTPAYMAPEQQAGAPPTVASDLYALGLVLHELRAGRLPARGGAIDTRTTVLRSPSAPTSSTAPAAAPAGALVVDRGRLPRRWAAVIARCLAREPAARFARAADVAAALDGRRAGARRSWWLAGAALAAAALAAYALVARRARPASGPPRAACAEAVAAIDPVWGAGAAASYRAAGGGDAQAAWLDDFASRWRIARRAACAAGLAAVARADACLAEAREALAAAAAAPTRDWPALPRLEDCNRPLPRVTLFPLSVGVGAQGVAALSSDGARIAVSTLAGPPVVIAAEPRAHDVHRVDDAAIVGDWLADGRLLVQRADGTQALRAPDGREQALPGRGDRLYTQINTIAPDGGRIAVARDGAIVVLAADDGRELARVAGEAHELAWEPDGRRLAIIARYLGTLTLLDTRTGATVAHRIGVHAPGLGEIGLAWLGPGRLALSGALAGGRDYGLWSLALDDASGLARAPELLYRAPAGQLLRLFDAGAGRVLLGVASGRQRLLRWRDGRTDEYPASFKDVRLLAIDRTRGRALGLGPAELHLFDLDAARADAREVLPSASSVNLLAGLRDGRAWQARKLDATTWELAAAGAPPAPAVRFAWPTAAGAPFVRCAPAAPDRCAVLARGGETLHVAPLAGDRVGPVVTADGVTGFADVARDGRRVLAPAGARVLAVDVATGAVSTLARTGRDDCVGRMVREDADDPARVWAVLLCADRFAIGDVDGARGFRELIASDGWVSGLELTGGGALVYSAMDWDPQLLLLDGL